MANNVLNNEKITILDGALGTMLQSRGLKAGQAPEEMLFNSAHIVQEIHREYVLAGADIICANTFGANQYKLALSPHSVEETIETALRLAKNACEGTNTLVALDIGPLGELLEPVGKITIEEAYAAFVRQVKAAVKYGADLIMIETMTNLYELKAAVLAATETAPQLDVLASMAFEEDGRTFTGTPVEVFAAAIEPLGVSALGINCSLGPKEIFPIAQRLRNSCSKAVYVKPNAGLPNPEDGKYSVNSKQFVLEMEKYAEIGINIFGGCCGTTPKTIEALSNAFKEILPKTVKASSKSIITSGTQLVEVVGITSIGERINPTGKKLLQQALQACDMAYIQQLAVMQEKDGACVLDVNVGAPGVDEVALLPMAVKAVQAVSSLPLQLDSANPKALEAALRVCNGKVIVNSTTGEKEKLESILPLCKRYGAAVVGLTLDERGIPTTARGRLEIAKKIISEAVKTGIKKEDVYIDCLTLAVSADKNAPKVTLEATRLVKEELGAKTLLGVSNVSFGLPQREIVNTAFLTMAMNSGLDMPILNPSSQSMMQAITVYELLNGKDENAKKFIENFGTQAEASKITANSKSADFSLNSAIRSGLQEQAYSITEKALLEGIDGMALVNEQLIPALDKVGMDYESGVIFLPQLLAAANAANAAFDALRKHTGVSDEANGPAVVIATVKGDVHDIGKNIAKVLLQNYGFAVTDLGRDVEPEKVLQAVKLTAARLVGLSALMTTTLPAMEETLKLVKGNFTDCKVLVGGAVLTEEYAKKISADYYAKSALDTVHAAQEVYGISE